MSSKIVATGFTLTAVLIAFAPAVSAQQGSEIRTEFEKDAARQWRELREQSFSDERVVIDWTMNRTGDPKQKDIDDSGQLKRFTEASDRVYYSIRNGNVNAEEDESSTHVLAGNSNYLFQISKSNKAEWKVVDIDSHGTNTLKPDFKSPGGALRNTADTKTFLLHEAEQDDRLAISSESLESFVQKRKDWIESFSQRQDKKLGRVVKASLNARIEATPRSKKRGAFYSTVTGQLEFLADSNWVLLGYKINYASFDENGTELKQSESSMSATYGSDSNLIRCVKSTAVRNGFQMKDARTYRPMTKEEATAASTWCYLNAFGLPEPD